MQAEVMRGDTGTSQSANLAHSAVSAPSPPKKARRTLVVSGAAGSVRYGDVAVLDEVDDDVEREARKQQKIVSQHLTFSSPTVTGNKPQLSPGSSGLSNEQIIKTYESCMKLSADNKINIKNCFGLQLIECLPEITNTNEITSENMKDINFQSFGSTIEAGAKIYSYRVDRVHQQVYQVMGTLGRMGKKSKKGDTIDLSDEEGEQQDSETGRVPPAKQKKRKRWAGRTVETNEKNLNVAGTDVEYEDDSLFRKVCSHFDEGGLSGLLLNNVHITSDGSSVRLHSISVPRKEQLKADSITDSPAFEFSGLFSVEADDGEKPGPSICPSVEEFEFTKWSSKDKVFQKLTAEEMLVKMTGASPSRPGQFRFGDGDDEDDDSEDDDREERTRMEIPDDVEPAGFDVDDDEDNQTLAVIKATTSRLGTDVHSRNLATKEQEYSYFDHSKLEAYVGPSHWQIKAKKEANVGKQKKRRKPRQTKKEPRINFEELRDFKQIVEQLKNTPAVPVQEKTQLQNTLMPESLNYEAERFTNLFLKRHVKVSDARNRSTVEGAVGNYNYNNPNDSLNYCPDTQNDSMDDFGGFDVDATAIPSAGETESGIPESQESNTSVTLLDKPNTIEKIEISYSKKAKKVNVRRLKNDMWKVLTADADQPSTSSGRKSKEQDPPPLEKEKKFTELAATLPTVVSRNTRQNLSVPIVFVCFLHMCNEKTLELEGGEGLSDFKIRQG